jgi:ribosomal-protein-serine acetyltransferase
VRAALAATTEADELLAELDAEYLPQVDADGRRTRWGFYAEVDGQVAGLCLLSVDSWADERGSTGADTLPQWRGRGIAPRSKPHLFFLAFAVLGLHRVETGCFVSNRASRRSIEKTPGFVYEGRRRSYARNDAGAWEDEFLWAILRDDWAALYDPAAIEIVA